MRAAALLIVLPLVAACAGVRDQDGRSLVPGQSTAAEVEGLMGTPADRRPGANGETVLWFPRLPYGRVSYAARIGKDGKLVAVEQRLTRENVEKLQPGVSRESDVRDLLGPPAKVDAYPRRHRDAWSWQAQGVQAELIIVEISPDGVVREIAMVDDPAVQAMDRSQ